MEADEVMATVQGSAKVRGITTGQAFSVFFADVLRYMDVQACTDVVLTHLHPQGPACPACGQAITEHDQRCRFWGLKRIKCKSCNTFFTAKTGTILQGSQFETAEIFILAVLLEFITMLKTGKSDQLIAEILRVDTETIRLWRKKFEVIPASADPAQVYQENKIL